MTDRRREEQIHPSRSAYMHYIHTTEMARRHERQIQLAQLDEEIRRDEAMMMKRVHDSRMKTENAIRELRLEQERRLIKEKQRQQQHEERRRIRNQIREHLERELARIKHELRAELAKEDIKCQKAEEESELHEEEERKRLRVTQEREVCLKQIKGRQPAVEVKAQEQKQRIKDHQSTATGQENETMQDETEEQRNVDVRENENKTRMEQDERSDEEGGTEAQTDYNNDNSNTDTNRNSLISDDTPQQDCTCSCISYDPLNISCAHITTLEVLHHTDRQEIPADQPLEHCIAQECVNDDIVQSDCALASLLDEQPQLFEAKKTNQKVHHVTDLQEKAMQRTLRMYIAEECASDLHIPQSLIQLKILLGDSVARKIVYAAFRDIVISSKNSSLCFKFLWWQEGTLSS